MFLLPFRNKRAHNNQAKEVNPVEPWPSRLALLHLVLAHDLYLTLPLKYEENIAKDLHLHTHTLALDTEYSFYVFNLVSPRVLYKGQIYTKNNVLIYFIKHKLYNAWWILRVLK